MSLLKRERVSKVISDTTLPLRGVNPSLDVKYILKLLSFIFLNE